jgi:hypothetical protein
VAFTQITVTCRFAVNADGQLPAGSVSFTPTASMSNGGSTVPAKAKSVALVDGVGTIVLDANDDAGTVPSGTGYKVTEHIVGSPRTYTVVLAHAQPAVNLADLVPATTTANYAYVLLDANGHVPIGELPVGTSSGTVAAGNDSRITGAEQTANKGAANGYASLDGTTHIPAAQVPDLSATYALVNGTVASVVRDASGKFVSDVEGGVATSVTRDSSGRIATVTTGSTTRTVTRNASGQIVGVA